jgi:hypothetical protein
MEVPRMIDDAAKFHWSEGMKHVAESLKGLMLLNGAAAVSTLTFLGNVRSSDDALVYAMVCFSVGALLSPVSFAFAYRAQLQYGNSNRSSAVLFHPATYLVFVLGLIGFGLGNWQAAIAFLAV